MKRRNSRRLNLVGQKFGLLSVIGRAPDSKNGASRFRVRCRCGKIKIEVGYKLTNGRRKSCGKCWKRTKNYREKQRIAARLEYGESLKKDSVRRYRENAIRRNIPISLTNNEILKMFAAPCHYCGRMPYRTRTSKRRYGSFTYNGIDRIDSSGVYETKNCVPCCPECNYLKHTNTYNNFLKLIQMIYKNLDKNGEFDKLNPAEFGTPPDKIYYVTRGNQRLTRSQVRP